MKYIVESEWAYAHSCSGHKWTERSPMLDEAHSCSGHKWTERSPMLDEDDNVDLELDPYTIPW